MNLNEHAVKKLAEEQKELIDEIKTVISPLIEQNPEHKPSIESTVKAVLEVIEGNGEDKGYIVVKRMADEDGPLGLLPATRALYDDHFSDPTNIYGVGLDISSGLTTLFNEINS